MKITIKMERVKQNNGIEKDRPQTTDNEFNFIFNANELFHLFFRFQIKLRYP